VSIFLKNSKVAQTLHTHKQLGPPTIGSPVGLEKVGVDKDTPTQEDRGRGMGDGLVKVESVWPISRLHF